MKTKASVQCLSMSSHLVLSVSGKPKKPQKICLCKGETPFSSLTSHRHSGAHVSRQNNIFTPPVHSATWGAMVHVSHVPHSSVLLHHRSPPATCPPKCPIVRATTELLWKDIAMEMKLLDWQSISNIAKLFYQGMSHNIR